MVLGASAPTPLAVLLLPVVLLRSACLVADRADPRRLYAATNAGVFVSSDGAAHWTALNEGLTNFSVRSLVIDPSGRFLHASTLGGGVFDIEIVHQRAPLKPRSGSRAAPRRVSSR